MAKPDSNLEKQTEILNRILNQLLGQNPAQQLAAIRELGTVNFSSTAIVLQLEKLALHGVEEVRKAALDTMRLQTSQVVYAKLSVLNKSIRTILLKEITTWENDGLVEAHQAEVLRRQYDFDIQPGIRIAQNIQPVAVVEKAAKPMKTIPAASVAPLEKIPPAPVASRQNEPPPSLAQILFSETSVRIYLYLGAFFVIAAAAILAALVAAARLPVLLAATVAFAAGAVGFKKRLPQPSFALAIVFSFLLPIDANVLADTLKFSGQGNEIYWTVVFLFMALLWTIGTWFYASRLFSLAAYLSLALGFLRFSRIFDASLDWSIFSLTIANVISLFAVGRLKTWKGQKFSLPLFLAVQLAQSVSLFISMVSALKHQLDGTTDAGIWAAAALTWLVTASFYAISDLTVPFLFFPWMAAASLFPVPWLFLSASGASAPTMIAGFAAWGVLTAFAGEAAQRSGRAATIKYHFPLLALSLSLFLASIVLGFVEDVRYGFITFLVTAITYTIIHILRPSWYVWGTALLAGLGAYFTLFALPFMISAHMGVGYQMLGSSLFLLVPELFFKEKSSLARVWNWPPVLLGLILVAINLTYALVQPMAEAGYFGEAAIVFIASALLSASYALRFKQSALGYLATTSTALSVVYGLHSFGRDWWLPALTALSVIYYGVGFFLARREGGKAWYRMFIISGLALGTIISLVALAALKATGGWYALIIAVLFALEMFTRKVAPLELFLLALVNLGLILILRDFRVTEVVYTFFGSSLVWLGGDAILHRANAFRKFQLISRILGGLLALVTATLLGSGAISVSAADICFAVYAVFFALYAWTYRQPWLGYASTASVAAATYFALRYFHIETWLPIFSGLMLVFYAAGFSLRKQSSSWAQMLRFSGLALGVLTALAALGLLERSGGWYVILLGGLFLIEMLTSRNSWFEAGIHLSLSLAAFLLLREFKVEEVSYFLLVLSLIWLVGDSILERLFPKRVTRIAVRLIGHGLAAINSLQLIARLISPSAPEIVAVVCFGAYTAAYAFCAWQYRKPEIAYAATTSFALELFYGLRDAHQADWLFPMMAVATLYYAVGYWLRRTKYAKGWDAMLLFSGLGLGSLVAFAAPFQAGGLEKSIPIAIAATFYAAEAFARRNVWLGFPANGLYLMAYFVILVDLKVDEPQFFTIGAAALGLLMHYLLRRTGSKRSAFITGLVSQLILLGTTYIQMMNTRDLTYFFILFFQALAILAYGITVRSRSLVIAPISFAVLAVATLLYNALRSLSLVFIIGITGIILLVLGTLAVLMRERITTWAERFSDWEA